MIRKLLIVLLSAISLLFIVRVLAALYCLLMILFN